MFVYLILNMGNLKKYLKIRIISSMYDTFYLFFFDTTEMFRITRLNSYELSQRNPKGKKACLESDRTIPLHCHPVTAPNPRGL